MWMLVGLASAQDCVFSDSVEVACAATHSGLAVYTAGLVDGVDVALPTGGEVRLALTEPKAVAFVSLDPGVGGVWVDVGVYLAAKSEVLDAIRADEAFAVEAAKEITYQDSLLPTLELYRAGNQARYIEAPFDASALEAEGLVAVASVWLDQATVDEARAVRFQRSLLEPFVLGAAKEIAYEE